MHMADGSGESRSTAPPSFVPPAGGRRPTASPASAAGVASDAGDARDILPPSIAPRRPARRAAPPTGGRYDGGTASPTGVATPPSFSPASPASPVDRRSATTPASSRVPSAAGATPPPSYAPSPRTARAAGTARAARTSTASAAPRPMSTRPSARLRTDMPGGAADTTGRSVARSAPGNRIRPSATRRRQVRPMRVLAATLLTLALIIAFATFGAWNWVDAHLERSPWLTDMAGTPGTSWLLVGSDKRDGTEGANGADDETVTGFRTDTLLVLTKPRSGPASLISIPRDTLTEIDGQYMKINGVAQFYGQQALVGEVEQITGLKIDHVAEIQFNGLVSVVDALGGIELCYDQDISDPYSGLEWSSGCHDADGTTALAFSRMRYADAQGDFGRAARQRQVISAVMRKALSARTLTDFAAVRSLAEASLSAVTVDEDASPMTLASMALAFRDATGENGVSGSVYWSDPDYYVDGVGSSVLLDDAKNAELFSQLAKGTHAAGEVGTLAEG